eukprot:CAMPEP_0114352316 /NCGR_PEP_ID=MMETSP0101-20121206/17848_1 /TAXON_ID=38822 ORGANISM="Pteridomonas danica, Strain PT" /NCGR_SAMPLE_ID=MMETSP0101 /ASSEMBLY_ACC=CAM_ASM_000211 /LENGTH=642 /DNA_ID=CAMNT_0001492643 /DNA_START=20 /DNA_END=1948 /DNA_ORIENTATION=-
MAESDIMSNQPLLSNRIKNQAEYPTKSWRAIIASASLVLCAIGAIVAFPKTTFEEQLDSSSISSGLLLAITNEYPEVASKSAYGWKHIAEPYKTSTLTASTLSTSSDVSDFTFTWAIEHTDSEGVTTVDSTQTGVGLSAINYEFTLAGQSYVVTCTAVSTSQTISFTESVMSKYVRREIRQLTKADREKFLSGTEIFHRTDADEGRKTYGAKFTNYKETVVKHLARMTLDGCTPYHGYNTFLTAHESFVLEFEQSLQSIDPSISMTFWDFTIDTEKYGHITNIASESEIFKDDWFGPLDNSDNNEVLKSKYFNNLPIPQDYSTPEHNGYGFVTDVTNANPSSLVTRSSSICGLPTKSKLAGCTELNSIFKSNSLTQFRAQIENTFHATMHMGLGGVTECSVSLLDAINNDDIGGTTRASLFESIGMMANTLWRTMELSGNMACATDCDSDTDFSDCDCSCADIDSMTNDELLDQAYLKLSGVGMTQMLLSETSTSDFFTTDEDTGLITLTGATSDQNDQFWVWLLSFTCHPGKMGPFATPLAANNDPIFWVTHATWGRFWHYIQLNDELWSNFDNTWGGVSENCELMLNYDDMLPFSGFAAKDDATVRYTNRELVAFYEPTNAELPYIFDELTWEHCDISAP